jgi:hypothetical protein
VPDIQFYLRQRLYAAYPHFLGFWRGWATSFAGNYAAWDADINFDPRRLPDPPAADFDYRSKAQRWRDEGPSAPEATGREYEVFPPGSVNLGLRLLYRQDWRHLGTQPGEVVRTLPLGPGQTERITTKIVQRQKRTSTFEQTRASESETETADSTKDSSELVNEAANSFNCNVSEQASAGFIFGSVSISASQAGTNEDKSRQTSSSLSEAMRKTEQAAERNQDQRGHGKRADHRDGALL